MATAAELTAIEGIRAEPVRRRGGTLYEGRYTVRDPLVVLNPDDVHATASLSIREIVDAVEGNLVWTDQLVQRGVKPGRELEADVELPVAAGYADTDLYVFYPEKADEIAEKLLDGERLHLNPLVWNLRPGEFEAYFDEDLGRLHIYRGRIYLPDGHHRHQAIVKAYRIWSEAPEEYPDFDPDRQFTVDIHFMSREEEGEFFFEKNVLGKPVEKSKSYDLTTRDPVATLAKRIIDKSPSLRGNVNRVTDRLTGRNPHVVTLSTLRSMVEQVLGEDPALSVAEIEAVSELLARFWEMLANVRPELGQLSLDERRAARGNSMAGQAVIMYGYAELMKQFLADVDETGLDGAIALWDERLARLSPERIYKNKDRTFEGDLFDRDNPLWRDIGAIQTTRSGRDTVSNVRQTRANAGRVLRRRVGI